MSKTGGGPQLAAYIQFNVSVVSKGTLAGITKDLKDIPSKYQEVQSVKLQMIGTTTEESVSIRRLLLDLRMFSYSLRGLRNEFGATNPVLDTLTTGLLVFSYTSTGVVAGLDLLQKGSIAFSGGLTGVGTAAKFAIGTLGGLTAVLGTLAIVAGGLAFIWAIWEWGQWASGIRDLEGSIKGLEEELSVLQSKLKDVRIEQNALNESTAFYQLWLENVEYSIEMQGYATEEQIRLKKYLQQSIDRERLSMQQLTYEGIRYSNQAERTGRDIEKTQEKIEDIHSRAWQIFWGWFTPSGTPAAQPPSALGVGGAQIGAEVKAPGLLYVHPGEFVGQPGELAANLMRGISGGNQISVSISLAGANLRTGEDLVSALQRGGREAAAEIERSLGMQKYGVKGRR